MALLIKGQKVDLTKVDPALTTIKVGLGWDEKSGKGAFDLDIFALLLDASGGVQNAKDVVFYNNLTGQDGAVRLTEDNRTGAGEGDDEEITIELKRVPAAITKIIVAAAIHEGKAKMQDFSHVANAFARIDDGKTHKELHRFNLEQDYAGADTVILGEVYRHNNEWKFAAVGAAVENGMEGLLSMYQSNAAALNLVKTPLKPKVDVKKSASEEPKKSSGVNLSKVELKKSGDKINLSKSNEPMGEILVNLNWNQGGGKKGALASLFSASRTADLDLGCFYEMENGSRGVVQALGKAFGNLQQFPYIHLDQDDRTGTVKGGENLRINGNQLGQFKRILVFAFIYEGVANWSQVDGVVTLKQNNGPDIEVRLDEHQNGKKMCAVALIENKGKQEISVKKVGKYYTGHQTMDKAFKWGMRWQAGSK